MATIQDIVTGALQKLGVVHANATPSATDSAYVLAELNDMMLEMPGQQIYINWTTASLTDTFELADHHIGGVKAMLAVRSSTPFGGDELLSSRVVSQSKDGYARLFGDYHRPEELCVDEALENLPGFWFYDADNINT